MHKCLRSLQYQREFKPTENFVSDPGKKGKPTENFRYNTEALPSKYSFIFDCKDELSHLSKIDFGPRIKPLMS